MALDRVKVSITSNVVGAAAMNWYFTAATAANLTAINTFLTALKSYIPSGQTYAIPGGGDTIDETTGKLIGAWSAGAGSNVVGSSAIAFPGQAGAMVAWRTGAVINGHHPMGRGLIVPITTNAFNVGGGLSTAFQTALQSAASSFLSSSSGFTIWHRPVYDRKTTPPTLKRPGSAVPALSATVSLTSATLRSRNH